MIDSTTGRYFVVKGIAVIVQSVRHAIRGIHRTAKRHIGLRQVERHDSILIADRQVIAGSSTVDCSKELRNVQAVLRVSLMIEQDLRFPILDQLERLDLFFTRLVVIDQQVVDLDFLAAGRSIIHIHDMPNKFMPFRGCSGKLPVLELTLLFVIERVLIRRNCTVRQGSHHVVRQQYGISVIRMFPRNLIPDNILVVTRCQRLVRCRRQRHRNGKAFGFIVFP